MAGPGRPRKNPIPNPENSGTIGPVIDGIATIIEPAEVGAEPGTETGAEGSYTGKKRGRKSGSKSSKEKKVHVGASAIASALFGIHKLLSARIPEMELERAEADALGESIANVEKLYDFEASEKAIAWGALVFTAASIYGQRLVAIRLRASAERAEQARDVHPENIHPFAQRMAQ